MTEEVLITSLLLLALAPVCALAADIKAQTSPQYYRYNDSNDPWTHAHNGWCAAEPLYDSLDALDDGNLNGSVPFSGKAAFRR